jgi:RNA binding exosome subunit
VRITEEDIRKFREIWREEFAEEIAAEEAREHITRLDTLYLLLARQPAQGEESVASRSEDIPHQ